MPFLPQGDEDLWDLAAFMLAPVLTMPTLVYSTAGHVTGEYPYGKPDWGANLRNAAIWASSAGGVYLWNYFMSPHNAVFVSGSSAWKIAAHAAAGSAASIAAVGLLAATPVAMLVNRDDPAQGRQLQAAGSGQPSIGSGSTWLLG